MKLVKIIKQNRKVWSILKQDDENFFVEHQGVQTGPYSSIPQAEEFIRNSQEGD